MRDLFDQTLPEGVIHLADALSDHNQKRVLDEVAALAAQQPFQNVTVPSGGQTSAAITNCGSYGWWSDSAGYRYTSECPATGMPWPAMPDVFLDILDPLLAATPAAGFTPDACLINRYDPTARLGLHQDLDETDQTYPIITWSLGLAGTFMIGGTRRKDAVRDLTLHSGDVVIMHGPGRMRYHGVRKIIRGSSPLADLPEARISLTFRRAR